MGMIMIYARHIAWGLVRTIIKILERPHSDWRIISPSLWVCCGWIMQDSVAASAFRSFKAGNDLVKYSWCWLKETLYLPATRWSLWLCPNMQAGTFCYDGVKLGPKISVKEVIIVSSTFNSCFWNPNRILYVLVYEQWDRRPSDWFKFEVGGYTNPPSPQTHTSAPATYWPLWSGRSRGILYWRRRGRGADVFVSENEVELLII